MKNRQPYWKPQHEVYIKGVLAHGDRAKAYLEAYPGTTPGAARTGAIRIGNYPHIRQRIEPILQQRYEAALEQAHAIAAERRAREEADIDAKRIFLAKLVEGEIKQKRIFRVEGQDVEIWQEPSTFLLLRAMELDCKLEAGYPRKDVLDRQFSKILLQLNLSSNEEQTVADSNSPFEFSEAVSRATASRENSPFEGEARRAGDVNTQTGNKL